MNLEIRAYSQIRRTWSWTISLGLAIFTVLVASGKMLAGSDAGSPAANTGGRTLLDQFRAGPMAGVNEIVFAARKQNETDGHWYANIGYYAHDPRARPGVREPSFTNGAWPPVSWSRCWMIPKAGSAILRSATTARQFSSAIARVEPRRTTCSRSASTAWACASSPTAAMMTSSLPTYLTATSSSCPLGANAGSTAG